MGVAHLFVYGLENNVIHIDGIQTGSWDIRLKTIQFSKVPCKDPYFHSQMKTQVGVMKNM